MKLLINETPCGYSYSCGPWTSAITESDTYILDKCNKVISVVSAENLEHNGNAELISKAYLLPDILNLLYSCKIDAAGNSELREIELMIKKITE